MTNPFGQPSIYNRLLDCAVDLLLEHRHWTAEKALAKAAEQSNLFRAYFASFKATERAEMERVIKARRNAAVEKWQAEA